MSMIADIKTHLEANGITETIKLGSMKDDYSGIALYQYAGQTPLEYTELESPGLQVKARYDSHETAMEHLKSIETILRAMGDEYNNTGEPVTLNGTKYHRIIMQGSAESLGWNQENTKIDVVQNYYVIKEME